jgi:sugar phosphate isomerase/epimerase
MKNAEIDMTDTPTGWTRREWLVLTAAGTLPAAALMGARAQAAGPARLGVQLYTVREQLKTQAQATLEAIAAIGYQELELGRADLPTLAPMAKSVGLTPVSTHIEAPLVTGNWDAWADVARSTPAAERSLARAFDAARSHGIKYAVVSYLQPSERGTTTAAYETFADQLNRAGETARAAGLTLAYHNHGFEFVPLADGRTPMDVLLSRLDPALAQLELDVFWVAITGADPADLLSRHKGRVPLVHLKDKAKGAPPETDERKVAKTTFAEVGNGGLDFPAILRAAQASGVQHYFVEQDQTPGDPIVSLRQSYAYLRGLA